jgi:hypothetical protein
MDPINIGSSSSVDTSQDHVVIPHVLEDIPGGRSLDVTGVTEEVLKAGRVIVEETSSGDLKPLKIVDDAYEALPGGHTYKGVLIASVLKTKPFASIMVRGRMNNEAAINAHGLPTVPAGAITELPLIRFNKD